MTPRLLKLQYTKTQVRPPSFAPMPIRFTAIGLNGPYSTSFCNFTCPLSPDYELNTRARAASALSSKTK